MALTHWIKINAVQAGIITRFGHCHWAINIVVVVIIANAIGRYFSTAASISVMVVVSCIIVIVVHSIWIERTSRSDIR